MDPYFERCVWRLGNRPIAGMCRPGVAEERLETDSAVDSFEDDVRNLWEAGFRSVVCLTDPRDATAFQRAGFDFRALPIPDGYPPTPDLVSEFLDYTAQAPQHILVHCEGGMGRTGTMLATYLMHEGMSAVEAINEVRRYNPYAIETLPQEAFLLNLEISPNSGE